MHMLYLFSFQLYIHLEKLQDQKYDLHTEQGMCKNDEYYHCNLRIYYLDLNTLSEIIC